MKSKLNILAPLSVSMVVITLGAAFGVLSGLGAIVGMISTCIVTLITALIGGSKYGVSSPTGPMTAAIGTVLILDQKWIEASNFDLTLIELVGVTTVLAAGILLFLNILRIHRLVKWVPQLVISGFVNGIALLIAIAQFKSLTHFNDIALMLITFAVAFFLGQGARKSSHMIQQIFSSSLATILIMSLVVVLGGWQVSFVEIQPIELTQLIRWPRFDALDADLWWIILPLAFELALIALLDTLLTAVLMDKKSETKTTMGRELSGQGIAMFLIGLIGGVPAAQSTVPSMMLWQEGGHHRLSKFLLALFCILLTFIFSGLIQFVPLAVFGGIILKVAVDVADLTALKAMWQSDHPKRWVQKFVSIGTTLSTVFLSLNLAVTFFTALFVFWNGVVPKKWRIPDLKPLKEAEGLIDEI